MSGIMIIAENTEKYILSMKYWEDFFAGYPMVERLSEDIKSEFFSRWIEQVQKTRQKFLGLGKYGWDIEIRRPPRRLHNSNPRDEIELEIRVETDSLVFSAGRILSFQSMRWEDIPYFVECQIQQINKLLIR